MQNLCEHWIYFLKNLKAVIKVKEILIDENSRKPPCTRIRKNDPNIELMAKAFLLLYTNAQRGSCNGY